MTNVRDKLVQVPRSQLERLAFIEARLYFLGELQRQDVARRFSVASVQASRDLSLYKHLAPSNLKYDYRARTYQPAERFNRLFNLSTENILWWLKSGLGDGLPHPAGLSVEAVESLCTPDPDMLAQATRAIYQKKILDVEYLSLSSGHKRRQIVPHSLVDSGERWHIRAFDRENERFSDFVVNRIQSARVINGEVAEHELQLADEQWGRIIQLELVPHPKIKYQVAIKADYRMKNGQLHMQCRAAIAGYLLRRWRVDCSPDSSLNFNEYHLALKDLKILGDVESASLAPGFKSSKGAA
jgi:predicted DNA-binding transcriptional regulator YafY